MVIGSYQLIGLLAALFSHGMIYVVARRIFGRDWGIGHILIIIAIGSVLATSAVVALPTLPYLVLIGIVIATVSAGLTLRQPERLPPPLHSQAPRPVVILSWMILLIQLLYAAFPGYRLDQWTYSLVVGRMIHEAHRLAGPIIQDHVFFTGVYEYLFVLPRLFWNDDLFIQCYANSFSWLAVFVPLFGITNRTLRPRGLARSWTWTITAAIMASLPEHEALINTKPDFILFALALGTLLMAAEPQHRLIRQRSLLVGLAVAAGVALKLTWLNYATALYFALALLRFRGAAFISIKYATIGMLAGLPLALPFLLKNLHFFGNPVHPVQFGPLQSSYWSEAYASYWQSVSTKPHSVSELVATWIRLPLAVIDKCPWLWFLLGAAALGTLGRRGRRPFVPNLRFQPMAVTLGVFVFLWPMFYGADAYPRFLTPMYGILCAVLLLLLTRNPPGRKVAVMMCLPLLLNSSVEVKIERMARAVGNDPLAAFRAAPNPMDLYYDLTMLSEHKHSVAPDADYLSHNVLSDSYMGYYYDGSVLTVDDFHYDILLDQYEAETGDRCIWRFLKQMNIRYIYAHHSEIKDWKGPFAANLERMTRLAAIDLPKNAYYLPATTLDSLIREQCSQ